MGSGGEEAACARGVGSGLGPGSGGDPGCGLSSWLPRWEQVTQGVQSRPRSGPGEKGGRRGAPPGWLRQEPGWHHSSPACGLPELVVYNGRVRHKRPRAQRWPGPPPTWLGVAGRKATAQ